MKFQALFSLIVRIFWTTVELGTLRVKHSNGHLSFKGGDKILFVPKPYLEPYLEPCFFMKTYVVVTH